MTETLLGGKIRLKKNRDFRGDGGLSSQKRNATRYLDPKYSRWMSADPALCSYVPATAEQTKKLPAGGVYNLMNLNLYHYGANNPLKYSDPTGLFTVDEETGTITADLNDKKDMKAAQKEFAKNENITSVVGKSDDATLTFNNADSMKNFMRAGDGYGKLMNFLNSDAFNKAKTVLGAGTDIGGLAAALKDYGLTGKILGRTGFMLDGISAYTNFDNGDMLGAINSGADCVLDIVGLYGGVPGAVASVYLKATKSFFGMMCEMGAQIVTEGNAMLTNWALGTMEADFNGTLPPPFPFFGR